MTLLRRAAVPGVLLLIAACSASPELSTTPGAGPLGTAQNAIVGGYAPDAPEHEATVALHGLTNGGSSVYVTPFCTGTLVTEDVVVTAAHCLDTAKNGPNFKTAAPNTLAVYVGDDPSVDLVANLYLLDETLIHPSYDRFGLTDDIALLRLSSPVTGVTPVPHLPASLAITGADAGMAVNFAGFGETEFGTSGVKLQADGVLGGVGCTVAGCPGPGDAATQVSYSQSFSSGGPCFGDSGGPMFVEDLGVVYLGGVTSYGDNNCNIYGVSTKVDAYEGWIDGFAGATPPEPPDCSADGLCNPMCGAGEDPDCGGGSSSCGDGVCGMGESCDGRSGTSACSADCDGKVNGKPSGRYCYVEGVCEGPACP